MAPVAAKMPSLKFSLGRMIPVEYAASSAARVPKVSATALMTIPGYRISNIREMPPRRSPSKAAYSGVV